MIKLSAFAFISSFILLLSGCSTAPYNSGYSRPAQRSMPKIPEVKPQVVKRPQPRMVVKPTKKPDTKVQQYTITSKSTTILTPKEVVAIDPEIQRMENKKRATVDVDPYARIPENSSSKGMTPPAPPVFKSSSAVKSLMIRARADLVVGNSQSAITKLERGLRIESQNPNIWHLLAKAHYDQSDYQQSITMAKKSIRYADNDDLISKNWKLIQKAGEKSDDTIALKEALDYFKVNP